MTAVEEVTEEKSFFLSFVVFSFLSIYHKKTQSQLDTSLEPSTTHTEYGMDLGRRNKAINCNMDPCRPVPLSWIAIIIDSFILTCEINPLIQFPGNSRARLNQPNTGQISEELSFSISCTTSFFRFEFLHPPR